MLLSRKSLDPTKDWPLIPFLGADIYLPPASGIYIVCGLEDDSLQEFIYIGQSNNLLKRWKQGHHCALGCVRYGATHIRYFLTDKLNELEGRLIEHYTPILNLQRPARSRIFVFDPEEWAPIEQTETGISAT